MERTEYISRRVSETYDVGEEIGKAAVSGDLYIIFGELGAGKTHLVKGIARGLGVPDWEYVVSPSFTLMNVYEGQQSLCHVDLYRLEGVDVEGLDVEEYLGKGVVAVEWAERAIWPETAIQVFIEPLGEEERRIVVTRPGGA
jgi:tRNA threonylcarbamoyladenosine biosynthesis protein TsaE